jgi:hypothetical protein
MELFTLNTTGFLITEIAVEFATIGADFGEGFEAAATVGSPDGTRAWSIRIEVLPADSQSAAILDDVDPSFLLREEGGLLLKEDGGRIMLERESTQAEYLWRAFRASKAADDQPFWIELEDPDDGLRKLFLASFVDKKLSYAVLCAQVYSTGLQLRQRRLPDIESPVLVT